MPRRDYAVLAVVSNSYSPFLGRFPRVTHPFATKGSGASSGPSFDLHVLSMPPAFVLSQDQTLKFEKLSKLSYLNPTQTCIHHTECVVVNYHHLHIPLLFNFQTAIIIKKLLIIREDCYMHNTCNGQSFFL